MPVSDPPGAAASNEGEQWAETTQAALTRAGFRNGGARRQVIELLAHEDRCLDAQQVFDRLRAQGARVGIASVYRTLDLLRQRGYLQRIDLGTGGAWYERTLPDEVHHRLVCTGCARVETVQDRSIDRALADLEQRSGYKVAAGAITIRGLCRHCTTAEPTAGTGTHRGSWRG